MSVSSDPLGLDALARDTDLSRYDLLLAVLPLPLLAGVAVGSLTTEIPLYVGAAAGAIPSTLLLGYALFVITPTPAAGRT